MTDIFFKQLYTFSSKFKDNSSIFKDEKSIIFESFLDCLISLDIPHVQAQSLLSSTIDQLSEHNNNENVLYVHILLLASKGLLNRLLTISQDQEQVAQVDKKVIENLFLKCYFPLLVVENDNDDFIFKKVVEIVTGFLLPIYRFDSNSFSCVVDKFIELSSRLYNTILDESKELLLNTNNNSNNSSSNNNIKNNNNAKIIILLKKFFENVNNSSNLEIQSIKEFRLKIFKDSIHLLLSFGLIDVRNTIMTELIRPLIENQDELFKELNEIIYKMILNDMGVTVSIDGYKLLSLFVDQNYFNSFVFDSRFWESLIKGLKDIEPLNKKRSSYILKKVIKICIEQENELDKYQDQWQKYFKWSSREGLQLQKLWNTFFLIYESLDEFTLHLISPVWKELDSLIILNSSMTKLDFHWIDILFDRAMTHQNPAVIKALVIEILNSKQYTKYLPLEFVTGTLIQSVSNPILYKGVTEATIHTSVQFFFNNYFDSLDCVEKKSTLYNSLFTSMVENHFYKDFLTNLVKFIQDSCQRTKENIPLVNDKFFSTLYNLLEIAVKRLHNTGRLRIYKYLIKILARITIFDQFSYQKVSKLFSTIPLSLHTNVKYHQLLKQYLNCFNEKDWLFNNIKKDLDNSSDDNDQGVIVDKDLIIKFKTESFIKTRMVCYLNQDQYNLIIEFILNSCKSSFISNSNNSNSDYKKIINLASILSISHLPYHNLDSIISISEFSKIFINYLTSTMNQPISKDPIVLLELEESLFLILSNMVKYLDNSEIHRYLNLVFKQIDSVLTFDQTDLSQIQKVVLVQRLFGIFRERSNIKTTNFTIQQVEKVLEYLFRLELVKKSNQDKSINDHWGSINSYFIKTKWMLGRNLFDFILSNISNIKESSLLLTKSREYLDVLLEELSGSNFYCSLPVFHCLSMIFPIGARVDISDENSAFDQEIFEKVLYSAWTTARDPGTLTYMGCFVQLAYHPQVVSKQVDQDSYNHHECLARYLKKTSEQSQYTFGLGNLLALKITSIWKEYPEIANLYVEEIYDFIVNGPLPREDSDLALESQGAMHMYEPLIGIPSHVFNLHQDSACETSQDEEKFGFGTAPFKESFGRAVFAVFIKNIAQLAQDKESPKHSLYNNLLNDIGFKFVEMNFDAEFTKKKEYILNTLPHRKKIRIWQTLCTISPYINPDEGKLNQFADQLIKIFYLFNLPSVRRYVNIFIVNFMKRYHQIIDSHLLQLVDNVNLRGDILSSIVVTAGNVLLNIENNDQLFEKVFCKILALGCSGHMIVKVVACSMISQLIDNMSDLKNRLSPGLMVYLAHLDFFFKNNAQAAKSLEKQKGQNGTESDKELISPEFENIFYNIPVLEILSPTEIINPGIFDFLLNDYNSLLIDKELKNNLIKKSKNNVKQDNVDEKEEEGQQEKINSIQDVDEYIENNPTSYQKKILPWAELDLESRDSLGKKVKQDVIICASFVDKVPNLAGLVRTSEIFNISTLVIPDIKVMSDPAFLQITVASEKWLNVEEVNPTNLKDYLLAKKKEGYSLLGVEQTSTSKQLNQYTFPQKSLLLLGHEKEGIPAEYINLLDQCIEIPQMGITRSLNVHVSGSILIWEYTKQQLNK
ncbi:hypothetical protein CYY_001600 [Polysphondylium violaceum]|uniref:tRNA (guanosine(18)-2'-O)-methyltransferase TARBP1 n=1 Tax=Polysphondylium violaceum TaxID=133409 RepID=A0A8J4PZW0_9MYCE|nr:hypothetical protein CYY_001600 [Polysphondylium violaceum]